MKNVLIIGAHYDDAELGAGGTAAKLISEGKNVYKLTLTDTEVVDAHFDLNIKADTAIKNSCDACNMIGGVKELEIEKAPYGLLEYNQPMMKNIERLIARYKIDTVFIHYNEDYNTDHVAAHCICKTAARHCKNILMYQSNPYILADGYKPNFFVDISEYIEKNKERWDAMKMIITEKDVYLKQIFKGMKFGVMGMVCSMQRVLLLLDICMRSDII